MAYSILKLKLNPETNFIIVWLQYILATGPTYNPMSPLPKIVSVKMLPITGGPSKVRRPCTMKHEVLQETKQGSVVPV